MKPGVVLDVCNSQSQSLCRRLRHQIKDRVNIDSRLRLHSVKIFIAESRR